jgi:hypothetical protein
LTMVDDDDEDENDRSNASNVEQSDGDTESQKIE